MSAAGPTRVARVVDAVQYAVGLTVAAVAVLLPVSLGLGLGLYGVKYGLFVFGVLAMGYGTVLAWPRSPEDLQGEGANRHETRVQATIRRVPPAARYPLAPTERYRDWIRVYLLSLCLLGASFAMETVFGVTG
ncbi:MAG: hypothetical protein ABEJ76_05985 [Halanaeroarchaeum sp.]